MPTLLPPTRSSRTSFSRAVASMWSWPVTCAWCTPPLLAAFPNRVVNLHPALPSLPVRMRLMTPFARGVKVTGVTVHFANEIYDNGPIIAQRALAVEEGWDVDTLEEHIHAIEHVLYPEVVQMLADGRVHVLESGKVAIDAPSRLAAHSTI